MPLEKLLIKFQEIFISNKHANNKKFNAMKQVEDKNRHLQTDITLVVNHLGVKVPLNMTTLCEVACSTLKYLRS